ncbi:beta-lactamase family protein [Devosia sp. WQ 349]|uniref:serine hydrolase domain-containing protein n=1 Tax=Devosia sp. WQ 349K1 TaxID=2800329 RepID=UPI001905541B|nr:serine hydrolase domain-containing protein [Devosia sp. WQ 349K1]MBK1795763.1 beta-lactamase family protein [Devosia sp. WQ 349K1]
MGHRVNAVMDSAIEQQKIVGAELLVFQHGMQIIRRAAGHFDREANVPMMENAIYRLASVTKPIIAATALAMVDKDLLKLDDAVRDYLPYFTPQSPDGSEPVITIHHLLTHTSGLGYDYSADPQISGGLGPTENDFEENFSRVAKLPLNFTPGTAWLYSVAIDVLGAALAKIHGGSLDDAVRAHVTGPLGMTDTGFFVSNMFRLAKPYADDTPPRPMAEPELANSEDGGSVLFSPARIFSKTAFQSGGAGMAGSATDLALFFETLRKGGEGIVSKALVERGFTNQLGTVAGPDAGQSFGYFGAIIDDPTKADQPGGLGAANWGGVYGHSWLVDHANELTIVSMTNTALEGCTGVYPKDLIRAVYDDLI